MSVSHAPSSAYRYFTDIGGSCQLYKKVIGIFSLSLYRHLSSNVSTEIAAFSSFPNLPVEKGICHSDFVIKCLPSYSHLCKSRPCFCICAKTSFSHCVQVQHAEIIAIFRSILNSGCSNVFALLRINVSSHAINPRSVDL